MPAPGPATSTVNTLITLTDGVIATPVQLCVTDLANTSTYDTVDATTLCDQVKIETPTFRNFSFSGGFVVYANGVSVAQSLLRAAHEASITLAFEYFPLGNATGLFSYTGNVYVADLSLDSPANEVVRGTIALTNAGAVVYTALIP